MIKEVLAAFELVFLDASRAVARNVGRGNVVQAAGVAGAPASLGEIDDVASTGEVMALGFKRGLNKSGGSCGVEDLGDVAGESVVTGSQAEIRLRDIARQGDDSFSVAGV